MPIWGTAGAVLAALALTLAVTGCGGGKAAQSGGDTSAADPDQAALAFARCMRGQGVDFPDPEDGRLVIRPRGDGPPSEAERRDLEEANEECGHLLEKVRPPELSQEDRAALQDALLEFARCMREQGVDVPDPDFSGGGGAFRIGPRALNPNDPDFEAARKTCQKHLRPLEERLESRRRG